MSNLRIIELEQQLKRRDEHLAQIEAEVNTYKHEAQHWKKCYEEVFGLFKEYSLLYASPKTT